MKKLTTNHGNIALPAFFPDATSGVVRGVDASDLAAGSTPGIVVNTYHLLRRSMVNTVAALGGIHRFMNWEGPIITDSGGFQVMSLIRENHSVGTIRKDKIIFFLEGKKTILTPEKCIQIQIKLGSDIIMCLDDCTMPDESSEEQEKSVERTILWAGKCKQEFLKLTKNIKKKPLIFAIIQGGNSRELRKYCAEELIKIDFDGYGFGGYPVDTQGNLLAEMLEYTAKLMPNSKPRYAMGIGKPENIVACYKMGYQLFDCVIPTRDARMMRLYAFTGKGTEYENIYMQDRKHMKDNSPVSDACDCLLCRNYSRAYLYHLFKIKDSLAIRLATIHNLRFYSMLMNRILREALQDYE